MVDSLKEEPARSAKIPSEVDSGPSADVKNIVDDVEALTLETGIREVPVEELDESGNDNSGAEGKSGPVKLSTSQKALLKETDVTMTASLGEKYEPGFGVTPSANGGNFDHQLWTRDFSHAAGDYFASAKPEAVRDALETIFRHQRADGAVPYKTEKVYAMLQIVPGIGKPLAKGLFNLIEKKMRKRDERPVYEGQDLNGAEDTIPAVILAAGEFFSASPSGKEFAAAHFDQFKKAMDYFRAKIDHKDSLAFIKRYGPDWTESIIRNGKLGTINILWTRSLRTMQKMAIELGRIDDAEAYGEEYDKTKKSVLEQLYDKEGGYFRAKAGEDRLDAAASVFGALYMVGSEEAVRIEESLKRRVLCPSGLKNFDPPYSKKEIQFIPKVVGNKGYHNEYVWPWVTCQNIQVKIKIALNHPDESIRNQYRKEAVADLVGMAKLFKDAGGAFEIFKPDEPAAAATPMYTPVGNFMGTMAAYQGAYKKLKDLGWI